MLSDVYQLALESLKSRPLRTTLTALGIVIAVATIVALLTITQGLENSITEEFKRLGSDKLYVAPKGFQGPQNPIAGLTQDDVEAMRGVSGINLLSSFYVASASVKFKNEELVLQIWGSDTEDYEERMIAYGHNLHEGRFLSDREELGMVIGYNIAHTKFSNEIRVRDRVEVNGKKMVVVGVLEQKGTDDDNTIGMSIDTLREITGRKNDVTMIEAKVSDVSRMKQVQHEINKTLSKSRGNENYEIVTPDQILEQFDTVLIIIRIVLIGIGSISLLVAGVGISNAMYTSVLERTKEIGIMKSIGAENKFILTEFLIESLILGLFGGILGVGLGIGAAIFIGGISKSIGLPLLIIPNLGLLFFGLGFALLTAILSGILPAKHASEMKPVDALRAD